MKICPSCGGEFVDQVEECPDCSERLKWEGEMPSLPDSVSGVCVATGSEISLRPVSAALRAAGIATRVTQESAELGLGLGIGVGDNFVLPIAFDGWTYRLDVAPQDAEKAKRMADELLGVPLEHPPLQAPVEGHCPACGASVEPTAKECPECSLTLAVESSETAGSEAFPDLGLPRLDSLGLPIPGGGHPGKQ